MGKSKSSGSSELDPAIRAMMQETFDLGKSTITERVPVLDAQGNQVYDRSNPFGAPVPLYEDRLKEYEEYGDPRFAAPDAYTTIGEREALKFLGGNNFQETDRLNTIYDDMYAGSSYSPLEVSARDAVARDVAAGLIDAPDTINRTMVNEQTIADPNDITAREILDRSIGFERVNADTYTPTTLAQTDISPYTNMFNQQVKDVTLNDIITQRDKQLSDLQSRAAQAGAFGGTRQAVEAGIIANNAMSQYAKQAALLNKEGFDTANQLATQDIGLLNQGSLTNIQNRMNAAQLNQAADLTAGQANLNAAMEAQRLNQARDLDLGRFNTEIAQQAAIANQAANLEAQGMNQDDAFRVAQANVDNTFRQQSTNVGNQLQADLANQAASLEASLANQATDLASSQANAQFGLDANAQNQQGLLNAAALASGVTDAELGRYGAMTDIGDRRMARDQQQLDFDYQQFLEGQEYQMQLAQFLGGLLSGFPTPLKSQNKSSTFSFG
ncbi:MAG: hypothetical protein CL498_03595 [Actinobacteria bacterium]|nr:hypothetical protein [Actinomycetota bacterium]|tara:strand:- start:1167 stop:2660 length:1494 start_codon:yes stop_codon:yes gene_type:complete